jgi:hypothetical protein
MNSNAVLLHDEGHVKGCKDFVGEDFAGAAKISSSESPGKDSCWIVLVVSIRVELTAPFRRTLSNSTRQNTEGEPGIGVLPAPLLVPVFFIMMNARVLRCCYLVVLHVAGSSLDGH